MNSTSRLFWHTIPSMRCLKFFAAGLLSAFLIASPFVGESPNVPTVELARQSQANTVLVIASEGQGSAVIIKRGRMVFAWTANHVVAEDTVVKLKVFSRVAGHIAGETTYNATVLGRDAATDCALLWVDCPAFAFAGAEFAHARPLPVGTPVFSVGNFLGSAFHGSVTAGIVAQVGVSPGERLVGWPWEVCDEITAPAWPGASGGPCFNAKGQVVGFVVGGIGPTLGVMVPVRALEAWAEQAGFSWGVRGNRCPSARLLRQLARIQQVELTKSSDSDTVP